jgi:hypothetical protein
MLDIEELKPGMRIRLSALGKERCPKMTRHTGVVLAKATYRDSFRVLMDGSKEAISLHRSYFEAE